MQNAILPDQGDPSKPPPPLVDISVLKRGGFNQISVKSKAAQQKEDLTMKQEEGKFTLSLRTVDRMNATQTDTYTAQARSPNGSSLK